MSKKTKIKAVYSYVYTNHLSNGFVRHSHIVYGTKRRAHAAMRKLAKELVRVKNTSEILKKHCPFEFVEHVSKHEGLSLVIINQQGSPIETISIESMRLVL